MKSPKEKGKGPYSYADYLSWREDERWEIIEGEAYDMTPAPGVVHQEISMNLSVLLGMFFRERECRVFASPFDVRLPHEKTDDERIFTIVQPDLIVVCDPEKLEERGCLGTPDLVIEIISPSTASKDHVRKRRLYESHGVKEFWLVHPTDRIVMIYRLENDGVYGRPDVFADDDKFEVPLFPGLEIDLTKVFPFRPPPAYQARKPKRK